MCWLAHMPAPGVFFGLKADSTVSLWRGNTEVIERQGVQMTGSEKRHGEQRGWNRERGEETHISAGFTLWTSANVIPIAIEAPLWSYERERSHTVLLSSLSLVLCLNYLWKTSIEGMRWLKGFHTNNAKSKKALEWTKKCHISLRSCQEKKTEPWLQRAGKGKAMFR